MNLTEEVQAEGRALVSAANIETLMPWVRMHSPVGLDHDIYARTMRLCFLAGDIEKAMRMHRAVFDTYDADAERAGLIVRKGLGCTFVLAIVGGLVAFVAGLVALVRWVL